MITEDYVSFETAELLKEKGFDEPVNRFYEVHNGKPSLVRSEYCRNAFTTSYAAPTLQMAMKWLREEHKLHFTINPFCGQNGKICYNILVTNEEFNVILYNNIDKEESYEESCEAAIKYCLENLI